MSKHILTNLGGQQDTRFRGDRKLHMDMEMFDKKFAEPYVDVDPMMVDDFQRTVIKDFGPDEPTFEHEKPRRNYDKRINLRSGARTLTDPWTNPGFNTQDLTKDPRGWTGEHNWRDLRRHYETRIPYTNFGDDSDNSVTSGGIHPNDLYARIAGTRRWLKSRLKIFSTSKTSHQSGGIGVLRSGGQKTIYGDAPAVTHETEGDHLERRAFEEAGKMNKTIIASNNFHFGSKYFRNNTTPDHEIKVSSYGKLLRNQGLTPHRAQIKDVNHTVNPSLVKHGRGINKNLLNYITADRVADTDRERNPNAATAARGANRALKRDIMSLFGLTEAELAGIRRDANTNRAGAHECLANIAEITEALDSLSHNEMLQLKQMLIRESKFDHNIAANRSRQKINPIAVLAMRDRARKSKQVGAHRNAGTMANVDPENTLHSMRRNLYVAKGAEPVPHETAAALVTDEMEKNDGAKVHSYKSTKLGNPVNNRKSCDVNVAQHDLEKLVSSIRSVRKFKHGMSTHAEDQTRGDNKAFNYGLVSWKDSHNNTMN